MSISYLEPNKLKTFILIIITCSLIGCQSLVTPTEKTAEVQNMTTTKSLESSSKKIYSPSNPKKTVTSESVMPKQISNTLKEYGPLALFKELSLDKLSLNFKPQALLREDFVKVQITLNDSGSITDINILESSGNKQLENDVLTAINKADPLPLPAFTGKELEKAKTLTIKFPTDLH